MSAGYDAVWREASSNSALTDGARARASKEFVRTLFGYACASLSFALHFLLRIFPLERAEL